MSPKGSTNLTLDLWVVISLDVQPNRANLETTNSGVSMRNSLEKLWAGRIKAEDGCAVLGTASVSIMTISHHNTSLYSILNLTTIKATNALTNINSLLMTHDFSFRCIRCITSLKV
jgi:hypothetical protein